MKDGTISGGMIPKVNTALDAVKAGVGASIIPVSYTHLTLPTKA